MIRKTSIEDNKEYEKKLNEAINCLTFSNGKVRITIIATFDNGVSTEKTMTNIVDNCESCIKKDKKDLKI